MYVRFKRNSAHRTVPYYMGVSFDFVVIAVGLWGLSVGSCQFCFALPKFRLLIVVHLLGLLVSEVLLTSVRRDRWMSWQDSFLVQKARSW